MVYVSSVQGCARDIKMSKVASWCCAIFCVIFCTLFSATLLSPIARAQEEEIVQEYPLHEAVRRGDVSEVNRLLSSMGPGVLLQPDDYGMLPLHYSSSTANLEISRILLERYDADPNAMPSSDYSWILRGRTPLHLAVSSGGVDLVDLLISKNANAFAGDKNGTLPLHLAIQYGRLRIAKSLMLSMGNKVHSSDKNETTPLHLAAQYGRGVLASNLIDLKAKISARNSYGLTPLHYASLGGHEDVVELLIGNNANLNAVTKSGATPLFLAARDGRDNVVHLLTSSKAIKLEAKDTDSMTPLSIAVVNGHDNVLKRLLQRGADAHTKNKIGMLPLHHAAKVDGDDVLNSLLRVAGGDIDERDSLGNTPLHYAVQEGRKKNVELLLASGADRSLQNVENETARDIAEALGLDQVLPLLR